MSSTTHADYGRTTDAATVAAAFPDSIKGRTFLITGVNKQGIGFATARALASQSPKRLIFAGRSIAKVQECIDALKVEFPGVDYRIVQLDLSVQASARKAAAEVMSWDDVPTVDVVINNAGVAHVPKGYTAEGVEMHLATNHLGHFILVHGILPKILAAARASSKGAVRIINTASLGIHTCGVRFSDLRWERQNDTLPEDQRPNVGFIKKFDIPYDDTEPYFPAAAYSSSKSAAVLFSIGLNERLYDKYGVLSLSVNPGEIQTELLRYADPVFREKATAAMASLGMTWKTVEQGGSTCLTAVTDPNLSVPAEDGLGAFLSDCQITPTPGWCVDQAKVKKLWELSEGWSGEKWS